VIEDSPYAELRFEGEAVPTLKALDRRGLVIFISTFSKILSPGLRVGWVTAPASILEKYVLAKQGADLHTSTLTQMLVATFLELFDLDRHIERIRTACRNRRDAMIEAIERELSAGVHFTRPQGGLFLWLELADHLSARDLLRHSLPHGVAFPPGDAFFPNGGHLNTLRLAYSDSPEPRIAEGIRRLGVALRELTATGDLRRRQALAS
jgi:DNA-binding transcriptional MocR family regulator